MNSADPSGLEERLFKRKALGSGGYGGWEDYLKSKGKTHEGKWEVHQKIITWGGFHEENILVGIQDGSTVTRNGYRQSQRNVEAAATSLHGPKTNAEWDQWFVREPAGPKLPSYMLPDGTCKWNTYNAVAEMGLFNGDGAALISRDDEFWKSSFFRVNAEQWYRDRENNNRSHMHVSVQAIYYEWLRLTSDKRRSETMIDAALHKPQRAVRKKVQEAITSGECDDSLVPFMTVPERIVLAMRYSLTHGHINSEIADVILGMVTPPGLEYTLGFLAIAGVSFFAGPGEIATAILALLTLAGVYFTGVEISVVLNELKRFAELIQTARTCEDLDRAADAFGKALVHAGLAVVTAEGTYRGYQGVRQGINELAEPVVKLSPATPEVLPEPPSRSTPADIPEFAERGATRPNTRGTTESVAPTTNAASQINPRLSQRLEAFRAYKANGGTMGMAQWVKHTKANPNWGNGPNSGYAKWIRSVESVHGNSKLSPQTAYLYRLEDANGNLLKWGITQDLNSRYPQSYMVDKYIYEVTRGSRADMLRLERELVETQPGPLNFESWAGRRVNP